MAAIAVNPKVLKNHSVTIGGTDYGPAVKSIKFPHSSNISTWKGGTPDSVFTDVSSPTYTCTMDIAQDLATATSLLNYLLAHKGETVTLVWKPDATLALTVTAQVILDAPDLGGDIDAWLESSLTHAVVGVPVLAAA